MPKSQYKTVLCCYLHYLFSFFFFFLSICMSIRYSVPTQWALGLHLMNYVPNPLPILTNLTALLDLKLTKLMTLPREGQTLWICAQYVLCTVCDACAIFKILYYVHALFTTTSQMVKEFIYWFQKSIVFVSWCLVDGWFWWTTISVNFLAYIFNLRLMYFLATILNKEDGWWDSVPNLCSKKWPGTLWKMSGPGCANTAHSIFRWGNLADNWH